MIKIILNKCRFCGGISELNRISPFLPYDANSFWWVSCIKCKAKTNAYRSAVSAIKEWNSKVESEETK